MALLEVSGVTREFGTFRAVENVSFTLEPGHILGFIGPNGAGKSTTMRIIATLDLPTHGSVKIDGQDAIAHPDKARPLIGYMPDRYGTYDDMTVLEFLDFFARAYGLKGAQRKQRIDSVMDFTGLGPLQDKLTSALSKGMKQRVALGRTLLHDPRLLILDEPADGLDPRARIELRELLRALADRGKAVLISSHILTELSEICDSCAIIEQGKLLAVGKVSEVLARSAGPAGTISSELNFRFSTSSQEVLEKAEKTLLVQPRVTSVKVEPSSLRVRIELPQGSEIPASWIDESAAQLIKALVQAELPVCAAEVRKEDLEDAFMKVTRGKVA
ncbi:MAG: ABC transporter ATP-binding protein [Myxococcaceae bacterium]